MKFVPLAGISSVPFVSFESDLISLIILSASIIFGYLETESWCPADDLIDLDMGTLLMASG